MNRLFIAKNATYPLKVQSILVMPSELEEKRVLEVSRGSNNIIITT